MYGSTCADMQANNQPAERHPDAFTRGRIIGKLEKGRSVTSVGCRSSEFAHSIVSTTLENNFKLQEQLSEGSVVVVHRGTTPADDRYIHCLTGQKKQAADSGRNLLDTHDTGDLDRPISRFTVARRLHGDGLFARRPVRCSTFNACPSEKAFSVVPGTPEWERQ
ncbi:hypothetical protein TNCV_4411601 [Trichonephila clavipes]|nr:hypothetical protein TNCV_4411601 [Trichonephila clavipes]